MEFFLDTAEMKEIAGAVERLRLHNFDDFALLHCVSSYPAKESEANLAAKRLVDDDTLLLIEIGGNDLIAGVPTVEFER